MKSRCQGIWKTVQ